MEMARIGATPRGGSDRQALTAEDGQARALLARWGAEIGLTLATDRLGNMALRREGRDPSRPPVAIGSHLDTQPTGGRFDGALGVLAGLEVLRALHEAGAETEAPLLLINWTNEEGARFSPPMLGSGAAAGVFPEAAVLDTRDGAGVRMGDALDALGWAGAADPAELTRLGAYFEVHIEQGPVLEREGLEVGVVTHALAQRWFDATFRGEDSHGGGGMAGRRDALAAAAEFVLAVERVALAEGGDARGTVGRLSVRPDSRNVVPGEVWLSVDTRHAEEAALDRVEASLRAALAEIAGRRGVAVALERFWSCPQTPFDPVLAERLRAAARSGGHRFRDLPSGIGHDAVYVARRCPAALLFIPCEGGISHNESESITPAWAEAGLRVVAGAVLATAGVSGG